jgi:SNF family Na+-dependent transporter
MALPCILFFDKGVFDEYDYWGGTISLFFFAMIESIAFSWVMGVDKGWRMINDYAELKIPIVFKYVLKYVTPTLFIVIFVFLSDEFVQTVRVLSILSQKDSQ